MISPYVKVERELRLLVKREEALKVLEQALGMIGVCKVVKEGENWVLCGHTWYGLQRIPLTITVGWEEESKISISAKSDDAGGLGAEKAIERLMIVVQILQSGEPGQLQLLQSLSRFELKTGFTAVKLLLRLIMFLFVLGYIAFLLTP